MKFLNVYKSNTSQTSLFSVEQFKYNNNNKVLLSQQTYSYYSTTSNNNNNNNNTTMNLSDSEWKVKLTPEQFKVLREKGTERAFTGEYDKKFDDGVYGCAGCGAPLYSSKSKFNSGCGWPAFFEALPGALTIFEDKSHGMVRTEIVCKNCGGHLGHVFKGEGFKNPIDERHCVNSISLKFTPKK
ncbi:Peptide methionine sulfoxide reductase [Cavenderia fasciculata]|uniref:Peptide-methionine (R)-S-oxide reductase n=1 Tax=Cavenderia fasciculata TaxID=261658 RepID=F4PRU5_CACFS|nr:Peptide methionine sulfoxide reductase [Cavenderia fasciculata]EGG21381.1 Peptide methionine sulfoxide reductase [Cavenderia fasciculata]|eukprot:XP_004359231.1 Peptide methionine sulfoxide reductase [Cavenderia fasciculata]